MFGDTIDGFITNGLLGEYGPEGGVPYTWQPDSLQGYYKYFPAGTDTASIFVEFTELGVPIESMGFGFFNTTSNYTHFSIPLNIPSVPDSVMIMIRAGDNPGSVLIIDDLVFDFPTGTNDIENDFISVKAYPNPASNMVFVSYNLIEKADVAISVYDIQGREVLKKVVKSQNSGKHLMKLDINNLSPGLYILSTNNWR